MHVLKLLIFSLNQSQAYLLDQQKIIKPKKFVSPTQFQPYYMLFLWSGLQHNHRISLLNYYKIYLNNQILINFFLLHTLLLKTPLYNEIQPEHS